MPLATPRTARPADRTAKPGYRPEIQGLRALAVVLVVVYHVWFGRVSGGVDVFFVLSGFLVTGLLLRAAERGPIALPRVWARMAVRLVPAALAVLAAVVLVGPFALHPNQWGAVIAEVVASALFVENWRLVAVSADYFAAHTDASAVQHFWSLAVQGQFYLLWPLLAVGAVLAARRLRLPVRPVLLGVVAVVFVVSLAYSMALTETDQQAAYFHSATRAWEFALGALLVFGPADLVLRRSARVALGWVGVLGLMACGMVLPVGAVFPGYAALWPTLCAAAVIVAGTSGARGGVDRFLAARPVAYLGDLSYGLYLWHWPILIFYLVRSDQVAVGPVEGAVIIAVSLGLAALTHHLVEEPARRGAWVARRPRNGLALCALVLVPVLAGAGVWQWRLDHTVTAYQLAVDDPDYPGALAKTPGFSYTGRSGLAPVPPLGALSRDWAPDNPDGCAISARSDELQLCTTPPPGRGTGTIVLVGDSHAHQLYAAVAPVAAARGKTLVTMLKPSCPFSTRSETPDNEDPAACEEFNRAALADIRDLRPDAVVTMATRDVRAGRTETTPDGFVEMWRLLDAAGIPVVAVRDNPRFDFSPAHCRAEHGADSPECWVERSALLAEPAPYERMSTPDNTVFVDLSDYLCDGERCGPAIGNVQVYMDPNHVTATYMRTLAPIVDDLIAPALGWGAETP